MLAVLEEVLTQEPFIFFFIFHILFYFFIKLHSTVVGMLAVLEEVFAREPFIFKKPTLPTGI
jgi:hypothetical protein